MSHDTQIHVGIKFRWWFSPAVKALLVWVHLTGHKPHRLVDWLIKRATIFEVRHGA